jgi:hypothetical protein
MDHAQIDHRCRRPGGRKAFFSGLAKVLERAFDEPFLVMDLGSCSNPAGA